MKCKIIKSSYIAQYYKVNQKLKKLQFYVIIDVGYLTLSLYTYIYIRQMELKCDTRLMGSPCF